MSSINQKFVLLILNYKSKIVQDIFNIYHNLKYKKYTLPKEVYMINFAVINLKGFIKNLIKLIIVISLVVGIMNIRRFGNTKYKKI